MNATIYPTSDIEFYKDRYKEITSIEIKFKNRKSDQDPAEIIKEFLANGVILESLSIKEASQLTYLPKELSTCPIKKLTILNCENFSSIEMLEHLPHLEYLNLSGLTLNVGKGIPFLPNLQELKLHYKSYQSDTGLLTNDLPDLHTLKLRAEEAINIGMNFPNLPKLRNLFIEAPTINTLEGLSICTNLEEIYLINLDIESLPKWFSNFKKVTWFYIEFLRKLRILDLDFSKLQHLQFLNLRGLDSLNFIDDSLVQCIRLERLSISYLKSLKSLPDLGGPNHALKELDINTCPIESLPLKMKELKNLEQLYIVATKLTSIPTFILQFEKLIKLSIGHTPTLTEIPNGMGGLPNLKNISFFKNIKFNTYPGYSLENTDVSTRALIFDWIIRKDKAFPLSKAVALAILKVINLDIKPFNKTLFADLHLLNFNKRPIDAKAISNGGKVFVSGRIVGNKTTLKEQLKELGLTLVNKLTDDVPFILLGKKLKLVEELYNGKRIFFTQLDLKHLKKEVNPGMLEQEQTPPEFVDKLDQLIWSKDIPNQLLAFEMVKQHGLPKPLEISFLVVYHVSAKGKFKRDLKKYLKTQLSSEKVEILESKTSPFFPSKIRKILTDQESARLYYTEFVLSQKKRDEFFRYDPSFPFRRELFEIALYEHRHYDKPQRFRTKATYLIKELDEILLTPAYKGQLNEARFFYPISGLPSKGLLQHKKTLKRLELFIDPKSTTFPSCIYELENLSVLNLSLENLTQIPDGISQLSSLKKLTISASNNGGFKYPTDITKLTNLTYLKLNTYTVTPDFIKEKMSPILKMGWD